MTTPWRVAAPNVSISLTPESTNCSISRCPIPPIGIESEPAYQNLDAILDVGDIDGVFIGPNDMSTSLGVPDDYKNPKYLRVIKDIIARCGARGVPVMVHQQTIETSSKAINFCARFVLHSTDGRMLQRIIQQEMNALRKAAGAAAKRAGDTVETV